MTTSTKSTKQSSGQAGMTLKDFKQALIEYGRTQIPEEIRHLIFIPDTSALSYMHFTNVKSEATNNLVKKAIGSDKIFTKLEKNAGYSGFSTLKSFALSRNNNQTKIAKLFPSISENNLLIEVN